ncbi:MAG: hypothetical protein OXO56_07910 [Gammaproteobacteria bacterium]|nr:hypothetical protein [Gammaproteobacteria bacterium]
MTKLRVATRFPMAENSDWQSSEHPEGKVDLIDRCDIQDILAAPVGEANYAPGPTRISSYYINDDGEVTYLSHIWISETIEEICAVLQECAIAAAGSDL